MNDKPEGQGVKSYPNGDKYDGQWKDWQFHGTGKYTWANGDVVEAKFVSGKVVGQAKITFANKDLYVGGIRDGKFEGIEEVLFATDCAYLILLLLHSARIRLFFLYFSVVALKNLRFSVFHKTEPKGRKKHLES